MPPQARKPTGVVPYPVVLLEGEEKAGKSWAAMTLSASSRVGQTWVLDLGEGGADEYGVIPGVRFEILEHDGTWAEITSRVAEVKAEAAAAKAAGEPPVVLVIDSITDVWTGLKDWASERMRRSPAGQRALAKDPDAELKPTQNLWNDANSRHRRLMTALMTFPGIVVLTARGKEVTEVRDGKPVEGSKVWSVDAQKDVPFDASVWVRMRRAQPPTVIGARSVHVGIRPGDEPQPITAEPANLLDWLIFDVLKVDPGQAAVRDLQHVAGGDLLDHERAAEPQHQTREDRPARAVPPQRVQREPQQPTAEQVLQAPQELVRMGFSSARAAQLVATAAADCADINALRTTYRLAGSSLLGLDVLDVLTGAQADLSPVADGQPVPLGTWLIACAKHAEREGISVNASIKADPTASHDQEAQSA